MQDVLGREIEPGDVLVYPVRQGSCMWLSFAQVKSVEGLVGRWGAVFNEVAIATKLGTGREVELSRPDRCLIFLRNEDLQALEGLKGDA